MTNMAASRKSRAARSRRKPVTRNYSVTMGTKRSGFSFTAEITITGRTASSATLIDAMPPIETVWREAGRREWHAEVIRRAEIDTCEGVNARVCEAYVAMLSAILELNDSIGGERSRARPKPELKIVGGYDRASLG